MARPVLRIAGPWSRRRFLQSVGLLAAASTVGCAPDQRTLNFYNWSLFIGEHTIENFEKQAGVRVNYEVCSSADIMFAKLKLGVTGYDLIVTPDYMLRRLIRHHLLQPLRRPGDNALLYPRFRRPQWDPDLLHCVPYLWGTTGIAYLKHKVSRVPDSWDALWSGESGRRVTMLDEKRDTIGAALIRLGFSGNSVVPAELEQAHQSLKEQKQWVRKYTSDFIDDLIRGETHLALAWSGDVHTALESEPRIGFVAPKEGSFFFVDNLAIPASAPHPDVANEFVEFYMRPETAAEVTNGCGYANPIQSSEALVKPELLHDPMVYPTPDTQKKLVFQEDLGASERLWDNIWEDLKR